MRKLSILLASFFLITLLIILFFVHSLRPAFHSNFPRGFKLNFIIITVDTLRADRLHCYGFEAIDTPTIDNLAKRGVKFDHCIAQTPLTLPSHTTILTGTLPLFHGVRDNGGFIVPPQLVTLAEIFNEAGYDTAAFIGAYVLDSRWGLDQGFDYYFDQFDLSKFEKISLSMVQRPANEVIDHTLKWLEAKKDFPFFLWIHLYDPHTPYEPPEFWAQKYSGHPYLGEIAFTDHEINRLWVFLENNHLLEQTVIIFTSDHGESLGEHKESTHGFFLYEGAIHVPLIFVTPFSQFRGLSIKQTVSLTDIMPTILEMAGLKSPPSIQGKSLLPYFHNPKRKRRELVYSETFYPRLHFGWSELRSLQDGHWKLILAPEPELYDLRSDPKEKNNLAYQEKKKLAQLQKEAEQYIRRYSQNAFELKLSQIDEETRERLAALGYISSFIDLKATAGKKLANPKDKIDVFNDLSRAREIGMEGDAEEAIRIIKTIIDKDPEISEAHFTLGNIYFRIGQFESALNHFRQALVLKPDDVFAAINIANCYLRLGKAEEAEKFLLDFINKGFPDSQIYFLLGNIKFYQHKYNEALSYYQECLALNPDSASAYNAIGAVYFQLQAIEKAEQNFLQALKLNPELTNANYNLAQVYEAKGMMTKAIEAYLEELKHSPRHFKAAFNLARLYRLQHRDDDEEKLLRLCLEIEPDFPLTYFYLARLYLKRGAHLDEAIALVNKGIALKPEAKDLAFGYFLLADLYNRLGNDFLSLEYARRGQQISRSINYK
ncbi:MAG: sulfatase-like hydrolase/transferase [Candidatus Aminicenantes bacterium]|nr:sulfatase-like hydrolase/transferase [Candidatus Aminicenantes bacterium]